MIEPVYKDKYICQYFGDNNDVLWELPCHFANAVFTDPPYELGTQMMSWQEEKEGRNVFTDIHEAGFGSGFDFKLLELLNAKLIKPNMMFFCNEKQVFDYLNYQRAHDLSLKILEWHKPNTFPVSNLYSFDTEFIIHMWKGLPLNGRKPSKTYFIINAPNSAISGKERIDHPDPKPEEVVSALIEVISEENDIIIDCFSGSGTTAVACKRLKRKCIAIEINEKYCMDSIERYKRTEAGVRQIEWIS